MNEITQQENETEFIIPKEAQKCPVCHGFRSSGALDKISPALVEAQAHVETVLKDKTNPFFNSSYADLASVAGACVPALNKAGIAVIQGGGWTLDAEAWSPSEALLKSLDSKSLDSMAERGRSRIVISCRFIHKSGQWIESQLMLPLAQDNPQGAGSAVTYGRRFLLAAMAGVTPEDDDGNKGTRPETHPATDEPRRNASTPMQVDPEQDVMNETPAATIGRLCLELAEAWSLDAPTVLQRITESDYTDKTTGEPRHFNGYKSISRISDAALPIILRKVEAAHAKEIDDPSQPVSPTAAADEDNVPF